MPALIDTSDNWQIWPSKSKKLSVRLISVLWSIAATTEAKSSWTAMSVTSQPTRRSRAHRIIGPKASLPERTSVISEKTASINAQQAAIGSICGYTARRPDPLLILGLDVCQLGVYRWEHEYVLGIVQAPLRLTSGHEYKSAGRQSSIRLAR